MKEKKSAGQEIKKLLCIILIAFFVITAAIGAFLYFSLSGNVKEVTRLYKEGGLYYAEYIGDYYKNPLAILPVTLIRGGGCTAFMSHNSKGYLYVC